MIKLRHRIIDLPSNGLDILNFIRVETTDFRWIFGNTWYFYYDKIDKPWFGKLSIRDREFEIRRNGLGLFIDKLSAIIVEGTVIEQNANYRLDVRYTLSPARTFYFIALVLLLFASPFLDKGLAGILGPIVMLATLTLWTIWDLKQTEKKFGEFIDRLQATSPNTAYRSLPE